MIHVAPSILSADFARLGEQVTEAEQAGAQRIHVDVMDGHFVPNLSMGPVVVKALRKVTRLPLEVHLMVEHPDQFVDPFLHAGADSLLFHVEVTDDPRPLLQRIRGQGKQVGLVLNPDTPPERVEPFVKEIDVLLCMTVHPGFSGQAFLPHSPERLRRLRQMLDQHRSRSDLEVDGGINAETGRTCVEAGANVLVAASAVFDAPDGITAAMQRLRDCAHT